MELHLPVHIVGPLLEAERANVRQQLVDTTGPIYFDFLSGLTGDPAFKDRQIHCGTATLRESFKKNYCDHVIRWGGVPTLRFWRDLEESYKGVQVFLKKVSDRKFFPGLAREVLDFDSKLGNRVAIELNPGLLQSDRDHLAKQNVLLLKYPNSELAMVAELAKKIQGQAMYVGNSLPVRHMENVASSYEYADVAGNRGANGIDGQVSTFLGWSTKFSESKTQCWGIFGDLTALYDLMGLWITPQISCGSLRIVVLNNSGGQIFSQFTKNKAYLNPHTLEFSNWAQMFGWSYKKVIDAEELRQDEPKITDQLSPGPWLLELIPDRRQTLEFEAEVKKL